MRARKNICGGVVIVLSMMWWNAASAQENFFLEGLQFGIGTRAIGMGGAYVAVGNDYAASYWNPAALATVRRFEITGGFARTFFNNDASFNTTTINEEAMLTKLSEVGVVYPFPTYRGSLVFSFGYNRVRNFDSNFRFEIFNPLENDMVTQKWREREKGFLNNWTAAAALDVTPQLALGLGANIWTGEDTYTFSEQEIDSEDIYTFSSFRADSSISSDLSGFNLTLGLNYRVTPQLRIGATISTPTTLKVKEDWAVTTDTQFDDAAPDRTDDGGFTEYKIRSPFLLTLGASLNLGTLLLSGQVEEIDWQNIEYRSAPPFANVSREEANLAIEDTYRQVNRFRIGAEYTLPGAGTQLRAGYYFNPSPFDKNLRAAFGLKDRKFYSVGLGFLLDKQTKLDIAYIFGDWQESKVIPGNHVLTNYVSQVNQDLSVKKIYATLSYRL